MPNQQKILLFTGCSFTAGTGWYSDSDIHLVRSTPVPDHKDLWVNICHKKVYNFKELELINVGVAGFSNSEIFESTVENIAKYGDKIDTIICQWTSGPRYNFNCGLERWDTSDRLTSKHNNHDINLSNGITWPRDYIRDLLNKFLVMHHIHYEIVKIVKYSSILKKLTSQYDNMKIFFVNGLCPWDTDYFEKLTNFEPVQLTEFTKNTVLEIDHRCDNDIFYLYDKIHQDYDDAGGTIMNNEDWINLYNSLQDNQIDTNFDQSHPGTQSNLIYSKIIEEFFNEKNKET